MAHTMSNHWTHPHTRQPTHWHTRPSPRAHCRHHRRRAHSLVADATRKTVEADVVVVGGGIIGLLTSQALLQARLSVAMVEKASALCAGATGAGQGYIWMAHRTPDTASWQLAAASTALWQQIVQQDPSFADAIEWQETGSLLLASTEAEARMLSERVHILETHGVRARLLSAAEVQKLEPAVILPSQGAGLVVESDAQINGRKTAAALLRACQGFGTAFQCLMHSPVEHLYCTSSGPPSVLTADHTVKAKLATVVAAGVWSGGLLAEATRDNVWRTALVPRRGHLLEVQRPAGMPALRLGMMEMSYTKHYAHASRAKASGSSASAGSSGSESADITFTATTSADGTLLIGSSRESGQLDKVAQPAIVQAIMERAAEFLPGLKSCKVPTGDAVRVGPRPYAVGGMPFIGPVPGQTGLFVAAGHEGSGLCLGPGTAQLLLRQIEQSAGLPNTASSVLNTCGSGSPVHWQDEFKPQVRLLLQQL